MQSVVTRALWLLLLAALLTTEFCAAEPCASICSTEVLWGVGSESVNYQTCQCEGTTGAARVGPNCGCGVCYMKQGDKVMGFAKLTNGSCQAGTTDCLDCDSSSSSSGSSGTTPTPTTTNSTSTNSTSTNSPTSGASSVNGSTATPTASSNASGSIASPSSSPSASGSRGSVAGASGTSTSSGSSGLATWQIALIICSCVLVFAVIIVTILSCYCKSKNRMNEFMAEENDSREYEGYWHAGGDEPKAQGTRANYMDLAAARALQGRNSGSSNHSRPNSARNIQQNDPTYNENERPVPGSVPPHVGRRHSLGVDERPAVVPGAVPRAGSRHSLGATADQPGLYHQYQPRDRPSRSLGSTADLPPVYQPFPPRERPQTEAGYRRLPEVEL